jgi:hypothetical protein
MDPVQLYETTISNRDGGGTFRFVTVPCRSLKGREVPPVEVLMKRLSLEPPLRGERRGLSRIEPVEAWSLPFIVDATLGRWPGPEFLVEWRFYFDPPNRRGPSPFAQYLTYAPVVPFESSLLSAKSLADLATAGGGVGAAAGAYATGDLLLLLVVPAGIIICGAARGVGEALRIGLRVKLLNLMGVEDPEGHHPAPEGE